MTNKWLCLAIACLATLLLSLDLTVLHLVLPRLVTDRGASSARLLRIGDIAPAEKPRPCSSSGM